MYLISSTSSIALLCSATQAVFLTLFDAQGRFLAHRVERRKARPKDAALALLGAVIALGRWLRRRLVAPPPAAEGEGGTRAAATISRPPGRGAQGKIARRPAQPARWNGRRRRRIAGPPAASLFGRSDAGEGEVLVVTGPSGCGKTTLLVRSRSWSRCRRRRGRAAVARQPRGGGGRVGLARAGDVRASGRRRRPPGHARLAPRRVDRAPSAGEASGARRRRMATGRRRGSRAWPKRSACPPRRRRASGPSCRVASRTALPRGAPRPLRPAILLLDEPTSACDEAAARAVEQLVLDSGAAVVWVTHDGAQAARLLEQPNARALPFEEVGEA